MDHWGKAYSSNVPVHKSHSVKELQTACHTNQLSINNGRQIPDLFVTQPDLPIGVC